MYSRNISLKKILKGVQKKSFMEHPVFDNLTRVSRYYPSTYMHYLGDFCFLLVKYIFFSFDISIKPNKPIGNNKCLLFSVPTFSVAPRALGITLKLTLFLGAWKCNFKPS